MSDEIRLTQLRRMLAEPFADLGEASAAIAGDPVRLARALVAEAAASDDVSSVESAREYIEARLTDLGEAVPAGVAEAVRGAVEAALAGWA
ncbi:MAG: hypothetical protein OXE43_09725 [Chloroflexi bacterium]|nr:hypothetical protein [Chloroflexota bacterium]